MAKKWHNKNLPGALHFVTGNVLDRRPIFRQAAFAKAFLAEIQATRASGLCKLIAFVLMPDHFHLVANAFDGDIQTLTGKIKSESAKRIVEVALPGTFSVGDRNQVWQESFRSLPLWSGWMIRQKIDYMHANPVKADLSKSAEDYPWSSFRAFYREEPDPLLAVDKDWWWERDEERLTEAMKEWEEEKPAKMLKAIEENRKRKR